MSRRPSPLPPGLGAEFGVATAFAAGVSVGRVRATDLVTPFHGVRTTAAPVSVSDRARAYLQWMPAGQVFTHTTAALLLGLRMPTNFSEVALHVAAPAPARAPEGAGIHGHQVSAALSVHLHEGLPVPAAVDVWLQCASTFTVDDLIVMGDGLVRRLKPLATMEELRRAVDGHRGARGVTRLRLALKQIRPGTDSPKETDMRLIVVRAGFPEPEVNGEIRNRYGVVIAHGDLVFRRERVVLEYEGQGHTEVKQFAIDIRRLDEIMEEQWRVIRVDRVLLAQRAVFLGKVETALNRR